VALRTLRGNRFDESGRPAAVLLLTRCDMLRKTVFFLVFLAFSADAADSMAEGKQMTCDAGAVQWMLGELPDDALVERARLAAGAVSVRVIAEGMMVTQDYREDRLNINLDVRGRVRSVRCG
jgi:hypothetical protein